MKSGHKCQYNALYVLTEQLGWLLLLRLESVLKPETDSGRATSFKLSFPQSTVIVNKTIAILVA